MVSLDEEVATVAGEGQEMDVALLAGAPEPVALQEKRRRQRQYRVQVFGKWCKGCGLCIAFCPRQVFVAGKDDHPLPAYPERCTGCLWCTDHCPDFAIIVQPLSDAELERSAV